jgi:NhaA family Na+:H+ antiporter
MSAPRVLRPSVWLLRFLSIEAASGLVLLTAATVAFVCANSPWAQAYQSLWELQLGFGVARYLPQHDLRFWVNDGLMTIFFLLVGLEIRREIHDGTLSDPRVATLPIIAALGGVVLPALLYFLMNSAPPARRGWAIPTATDIAFAVGVLALVARVPPALRMLLLTLAIIDDIAAIVIIACFYSGGIDVNGLLVAGAGVLLVLLLQWFEVQPALAYVAPGAVVWYGMLHAGVHPTLSGVLLGLLTPATVVFGRGRYRSGGTRVRESPRGRAAAGTDQCSTRAAEAPVLRVEAMLHPYVAFGIMPLFALANAGVSLQGPDLTAAAPLAVGAGVGLGLVLGKPVGILLASLAAVNLKLCALPESVGWRHMALLGALGGIGFTMSIFIAQLAFKDARLLAAAKLAVLVASVLAAAFGFILGRLQPVPPQGARP